VAQSLTTADDAPEVAALRKKIRGETLTDEERTLLAHTTRAPTGAGAVPHEAVEALLEERRRTRG
jgi:hypothetical protein